MTNFFPEGRWRLIQLISLLFLINVFLNSKLTLCTGGQSSTSTTATVEVYGVTEANLDQMYTQLLLDTDDVEQAESFDQLHCRISTFLFYREIAKIREEQKAKIDAWLIEAKQAKKRVEKGKKKKSEKVTKLRDANLMKFLALVESFDQMKSVDEHHQCQWSKFNALGELWNLLRDVNRGKDIDQLELPAGALLETTTQANETLLRVAGRIHRNVLIQLVFEYRHAGSQGELIKGILLRSLGDNERMLAMKRRLRLIVGNCMFELIELVEPDIFRIDLVDPAHLLSLYQRVLSLRVDLSTVDHHRNSLLYQISIPRAFRIIRNMEIGHQNDMAFIREFQLYWKNNVRELASDLQAIMYKLIDFWNLHNLYEIENPVAEFNEWLVKEDRDAMLKLLQTAKLGEKFKQFLDENKGAKGRLIYMLSYGVDAHKFVLENHDLARLMVGDQSDEELVKELINAYTEWFSSAGNDNPKSQKAHLTADVLVQIRELRIELAHHTAAFDQWTLYRPMLLIFLDQLEDAEPEFVLSAGLLYKQMLFKLWEWNDQSSLDFEVLLGKEIKVLTEFCGVMATGKRSSMTQRLIELDKKLEKEWTQNYHRGMVGLMKGTLYGEQLERSLNPEARRKFDAYMKREAITSDTTTTPENKIILASANTASTSTSSLSTASECPRTENEQQKTSTTVSTLDKGLYQSQRNEYYLLLILNDEPVQQEQKEWEERLDLCMSIWHYAQRIKAMLALIGKEFRTELDALKSDWKMTDERLELEESNDRAMAEAKLCEFYLFIKNRLYEFLERIYLKMENDHADDHLLFLEAHKIVYESTVLNGADKLHCDNSDNSTKIAKIMINNILEKKLTHFHYLDFLLKEYGEIFNVHFHKHNNVLTTKDRLCTLLGAALLELLERLHPDVLKIHRFQDDVRFYLYEQFMENRKDSTEATGAEYRLTFTISLGQLEEMVTAKNLFWNNVHVHEAVLKKTKWLKQFIFADPNGMIASAPNICLLCSFRNLLVGSMMKMNSNYDPQKEAAGAISRVTAWNGKECTTDPEYANTVVLQQRNELSNEHKIFLYSHIERVMEMITSLGRYARLTRLIPGLDHFKCNEKLLTSDSLIRYQIQHALLDNDEEKREMCRLGLNFVSWAHGINTELAAVENSAGQPIAKQILREIWRNEERQQKLLRKFDAIFDQHLSDLQGQFGMRLTRMQVGLLELVRERRQSKVKSEEKWRKMVENQFDKELEPPSANVRKWKGNKDEFLLWLQGLNRQEMLKQLTRRQHHPSEHDSLLDDDDNKDKDDDYIVAWRLHLKYSLEEDENALKRLSILFGQNRAEIAPILEAIPMEIELFDKLEFFEEPKREKIEEDENQNKKYSELENNSSRRKNAAGKSHKQPLHLHHGSKQQTAMETSESSTAVVGINTKTKLSTISNQAGQRTDETENDRKVGILPPEPKVKEEVNAGAQVLLGITTAQPTIDDEGNSMVYGSPLVASPSTISAATDERKSELHSAPSITPPPRVIDDKKNKSKWKKKKKQGTLIAELKVEEEGRKIHVEGHSLIQKEIKVKKEAVFSSPMLSPLASPKTLTPVVEQKSEVSSHTTTLLKSNEMEATATLIDMLRKKGYMETPELNQRIEEVVEGMKSIVHKWNNDAVLLIGGSYLLQVHTTHSDIDAVLLLPFEEESRADDDYWIELCQQQFFGYQIESSDTAAEEIICNFESKERHCTNSSLYCILCRDMDVTSLLRMNGRDGEPLLKLNYLDFDFDISFISMPKGNLEKFYACSSKTDNSKLFASVRNFDILITGFIDWIGFDNDDSRKGMLRPLSGYRANMRMRDLLKGKPESMFQPALLALKLWAKNHFVYGGMFGLLNGSTLTTMLLHVFLKNSDDSVPSLLEKFFDTFYHWKWPAIVELDRALKVNSIYNVYDWKVNMELYARSNQLNVHMYKFLFAEHAQLIWPVIVPGFPTQNAAFNVNGWTKQAIRRQFGKALSQMKAFRKQISRQPKEMIRENWDKWLNGGVFENKYDHFVAIVCAVNSSSAQQMGKKFCDFVESRIRLQLLFTFGDLSHVIQWMHASPEKVLNNASCPSDEEAAHRLPVASGDWHCTVWLVGVQLVNGKEQGIRQILEDKLTQMDLKEKVEESGPMRARLENFTEKIYGSFKYQQSVASSSSPRGLHKSKSGLSTNNAESPRGSVIGSPRGSPSYSAEAALQRRQSTAKLASFTRQSSMPQFVEAKDVIDDDEVLWAKYLDRSQLKQWLPKKIAV